MLLRNILLILGGLTLVAGAVLAVLWIRMPSAPANNAGQAAPPPAILIAATDIPTGTLLRKSDMNWMIVEPSAIAPGDIVRGQISEASFIGAVARRNIAAGEPLRADDLVRVTERDFLAAALAPGMQAVSLAVDASQSVAGLIEPGDRVDAVLLETLGDNAATGGSNSVGVTVLRGARVVAVDQWFSDATKPVRDSKTATPDSRIPRTITLELSAVDAKRVLVASQLGRVALALRSLAGAPAGSITLSGWAEPVWSNDVTARQSRVSSTAPIRVQSVGAAHGAVLIMRGAKTETQ